MLEGIAREDMDIMRKGRDGCEIVSQYVIHMMAVRCIARIMRSPRVR